MLGVSADVIPFFMYGGLGDMIFANKKIDNSEN